MPLSPSGVLIRVPYARLHDHLKERAVYYQQALARKVAEFEGEAFYPQNTEDYRRAERFLLMARYLDHIAEDFLLTWEDVQSYELCPLLLPQEFLENPLWLTQSLSR